ncbi:hypothetical protein ONA70_21390 [Micromonospora yasonensis]|uniref:hypothetical protein n=1 Tax=Micromonospora yasonensis TaxID=1128667 RepID=UPI00222F70C2|nr:hypothetical protein [Micromonospora yasonensis]MCW3842656.1 hypothetical protein [Micromonospora yasonensis]
MARRSADNGRPLGIGPAGQAPREFDAATLEQAGTPLARQETDGLDGALDDRPHPPSSPPIDYLSVRLPQCRRLGLAVLAVALETERQSGAAAVLLRAGEVIEGVCRVDRTDTNAALSTNC